MRLAFVRPCLGFAVVVAIFHSLIPCARAQSGGGGAVPYAGTFSAGAVTLRISQDDNGYRGMLRVGDAEFPIRARMEADVLKGTFRAGEDDFEFTARLEDDVLILQSDGNTHRLSRSRGNPLSKAPASSRPNPLAEGERALEEPEPEAPGGSSPDPALPQRRSHLVGVTVSAPSDWQIQESEAALLLLPPGASRDGAAPTEVYVLVYAVTQASSAHDQALIDKVSGEIRQLNETLKPEGKPERFQSPLGPAVRVAFSGRSDEGQRIRVAADFVVHRGVVVGLLAIGESAAINARKETARRIFSGFRASEPGRDPKVTGTWRRSESYSDTLSGFSMATESKITLAPSGAYQQSSQAAGGNASTGLESQSAPTRGRWFARDGVYLLLSDEGDTIQGTYRIVDGSLVITPSGGSRQIWNR